MTFVCIECGKNLDENTFYRNLKNRCKCRSNKKIECELRGTFFTKKSMTTQLRREHHQNESSSNVIEKPKID